MLKPKLSSLLRLQPNMFWFQGCCFFLIELIYLAINLREVREVREEGTWTQMRRRRRRKWVWYQIASELWREKNGLTISNFSKYFWKCIKICDKGNLFRFSPKIQTSKTITATWSNYLTLEMQIKMLLWKRNNLLTMKTFLHFTSLQSYFQTCIKNYLLLGITKLSRKN